MPRRVSYTFRIFRLTPAGAASVPLIHIKRSDLHAARGANIAR
jgi:hypothetical protein